MSTDSTIALGSVFHNFVAAGIKHLEYWLVLYLILEKVKLLATVVCLVLRTGCDKSGKDACNGWEWQ